MTPELLTLSTTMTDELCKPDSRSRLGEAEFSQPCCTAVQLALVDMLCDWGLQPQKVVGHSSGEIAGAYASGAISADDAIRIAYYRGLVAKDLAVMNDATMSKGGMAAIGLGHEDVTPFLKPGVMIACENSPSSVTLSGDLDALVRVMESIKSSHHDTLVRQLRVDCAYHSHHMKRVASRYRVMLGGIEYRHPTVPFYSSVTAGLLEESTPLDADYWTRNLTSPVLFSQAVSQVVKENNGTAASSHNVFLEVGPHPALAGPLRQNFRANSSSSIHYSQTLIRNQSASASLLATAGTLFQQGVPLDFTKIVGTGRVLVDLPIYPWQRSGIYWSESRISKAWRLREHAHHDILGSQVGEIGGAHPTWRNLLSLDDVPWLRDHKVGEEIIFPGAAYVAMAGEVIRQLTGATDFTVREVTIGNALSMHEATSAEIITTAKPVRVTTSLESPWYEFSISSLRNDAWVKHAFGQVRAGSSYTEPNPEIRSLQREVDSRKWYSVMRRAGLFYEGKFHGLENITAAVTSHQAVAQVENETEVNGSRYSLSPSTIDCAFQLFSVAAFQGLSRLFSSLAVPTFIGELYIKSATGKMTVSADAKATRRGAVHGNAVGVMDGQVVLRLKDLRLFPLDQSADSRGDDPHAAVEFVWRPDINLIDNTLLMKWRAGSINITQIYGLLIDKMSLACMVESSVQLEGHKPAQDYLRKYRTWLGTMRQKAVANTYPNVKCGPEITAMSSEDRVAMIEDIYHTLKSTPAWAIVTATYRIFGACKDIFKGETNPLSMLLADGTLSGIYDDLGRVTDITDLFVLAAHYKPKLRILEVGAGTGGTTNIILPILQSKYGERMYYSYTYTDISTGFFVAAKNRFKDYNAITYQAFDITADPIEQGFEPHSYDVIVASNVLHATPRITESLKNLHQLLAPGGRLYIQELNPRTKWTNYIMGTLPGWWLGEADGRRDEPYLSPEDWDARLRDAGFEGVHALHLDQDTANMIAMPVRRVLRERKITLLCLDSTSRHVTNVQRALQAKGVTVDLYQFGCESTPVAGQDILAVMDIERPFFHDMTEVDYESFKGLLAEVQGAAGILWVTGAAQVKCRDPRYGVALGLARTLRNETEIEIGTLELDRFDEMAWDALAGVLAEFQSRPLRDDPVASEFKPNLEWAFADGMVHVGRFHWTSVNKELVALGAIGSVRKLDFSKRGLLSSLYWRQYEPPVSLIGNMVTIQTRAVGLNFKDVLVAMGIVEGQPAKGCDDDGLGCESAGIVEKVGPEVKGLVPGDRVMAFGAGTLTTALTTFEPMCVKIPKALSFDEAATMAAVYVTVIHSLIDKAQLETGQSVLIHSACGGVGIAAIQVR
jgi:malonyl CoA-acyl carrier protein transacylase